MALLLALCCELRAQKLLGAVRLPELVAIGEGNSFGNSDFTASVNCATAVAYCIYQLRSRRHLPLSTAAINCADLRISLLFFKISSSHLLMNQEAINSLPPSTESDGQKQHIITIVYGGTWVSTENSKAVFKNPAQQKAFVIDGSTTVEFLRRQIRDRFRLSCSLEDIQLTHLHPFKDTSLPFDVDSNEDLKEFIVINGMEGVHDTLNLCIPFVAQKALVAQKLPSINQEQRKVISIKAKGGRPQQREHPSFADLVGGLKTENLSDNNDTECEVNEDILVKQLIYEEEDY